ncbi:MAG: NAD-dependent deacylase [Phycisphaerales bacterium]|nr:NAD-dependent deacylase [Phycisphaerales bacterium]
MSSTAEAHLAAALREARGVVVLTGAGVSAESKIPTFRDAMSGLWKDFDPMKLATPEAFDADPAMVTKWYDWRRLGCLAAEPHPGHLALAALERRITSRGGAFTILTQNVDGLHQRAGVANVIELHGSIMRWRCIATGMECEPEPVAFETFPPRSPFHAGDNSMLRPSVVWFGEMLPERAIEAAADAMETCDLFLSVGTSSVVYPAAGYIDLAMRVGARTAEVNPEATPYSDRVTWSIRGKAGDVLPRVMDLL